MTLAHDGPTALRDRYELLYRRQSDRPNALWQADHTELDLLVLDADGTPARPWLSVALDDCSRAVAGYRPPVAPSSSATPEPRRPSMTVPAALADGADKAPLLDVAYHHEPYWHAHQSDWIKSLLLFFDGVAVLVPDYMRDRPLFTDPTLAQPLAGARPWPTQQTNSDASPGPPGAAPSPPSAWESQEAPSPSPTATRSAPA